MLNNVLHLDKASLSDVGGETAKIIVEGDEWLDQTDDWNVKIAGVDSTITDVDQTTEAGKTILTLTTPAVSFGAGLAAITVEGKLDESIGLEEAGWCSVEVTSP